MLDGGGIKAIDLSLKNSCGLCLTMVLIFFTCVRKTPQKDFKLESSSGLVLGSLDFEHEAVVA